MKTKKTLSAIIAALILLCSVSGAVYLRKTYVKIEGRICRSDIQKISPDLRFTKIKEINRCADVEEILLSSAYENAISSFADFKKLSVLSLSFSSVNSSDSKKISTFSNLQELYIYRTDIDLKGIGNSDLSYVWMMDSDVKNFNSLAECLSLRSIVITNSLVDDSIIKSESKYVMKDSRFLDSFDNITELSIYVDNIEDASGICEMDSLQKLTVYSDSFPDEAKKILEDKEIKFILKPSFTSIKNKRYSWTE